MFRLFDFWIDGLYIANDQAAGVMGDLVRLGFRSSDGRSLGCGYDWSWSSVSRRIGHIFHVL